MEKINKNDVKELIQLAIKEDIENGDVTSEAIFRRDEITNAKIISKDNGIFCGSDMVKYVYELIDPAVKVNFLISDGDAVEKSTEICNLQGPVISILSGERIVLNFIQRMSGIATGTNHIVSMLKGSGIKILDTRKTLPGFRILDKYSVKIGGGTNHRMGLYDMVMIKDNHIKAAGNIAEAVRLVREKYGSKYKIEVETKELTEVQEAINARIDIIMLDNMNRETMQKAVYLIKKKAEIEISGNIDENKIKDIIDLNVDYISMGALTHSVKAFDLSMLF